MWGGASLIFLLERLVRVRVTHSGLGYIKEEHTLLASLQIPLSHHPTSLFMEIRGWAGTGCKTDALPKICIKSFDLIENVNVIRVRKYGMK